MCSTRPCCCYLQQRDDIYLLLGVFSEGSPRGHVACRNGIDSTGGSSLETYSALDLLLASPCTDLPVYPIFLVLLMSLVSVGMASELLAKGDKHMEHEDHLQPT